MIDKSDLKVVSTRNDYISAVEILKKINDYYKTQGIKFIFIPVPNSSLMYSDLIKEINLPDNHKQLIEKLDKHNILHIDTLKILKKNQKKDLWLYDDHHWSKNSIKIIGDEMIKLLEKELNK